MRTPQGKVCCERCGGTAVTHDTRTGGHAFVPSEPEDRAEREANARELERYMRRSDALAMMYGK